MTYHKCTTIAGAMRNGKQKCLTPRGHWNLDSATRMGRKSGLVGTMRIAHEVSDLSGRGRGGHDGRWTVGPRGKITKLATWSEFGREH